jgi:hypothetical protein
LFSPLGIASAYLLAVPFAGAVLAAASLRRIRASGDELSGRRLAMAGLMFCCFFGAWAIAQDVGRRWVISEQARQFSDGWLQLMVEGKSLEAYQWKLDPNDRGAAAPALEQQYEGGPEEARRSYLASLPFRADDQGSALREFRFLRNESVTEMDTGEDVVIHRYEIVHEKNGKAVVETVLMNVRRIPDSSAAAVYWQLGELVIPRG